jgi:ribosome maturation protein SDO1
MSGIFTPINQVKLTNVSIVKLKKAGKRFELACYKNKLFDYRSGSTTNLDEILQSLHVFSNVGKGLLASSADLKAAFGPEASKDAIIKEILEKGEVQVGEREREHQLGTMFREIASMVSERCLNPTTKLPYPVSVIERAMTEELHYSVKFDKSAKQQALEVIKLLQTISSLQIVRAKMRLLLSPVGQDNVEEIKSRLVEMGASIEAHNVDDSKLTILIEPGAFRPISELVQSLNSLLTDKEERIQLDTLSLSEC